MPSNAVFCRAVAEQGYNLVPGFVTPADQPGARDGRTTPSNTAIRRPAGFLEGNCSLPQTGREDGSALREAGGMPVTVTYMTGLAWCARPGRTWMRGCTASIGAKAGNRARIRAISVCPAFFAFLCKRRSRFDPVRAERDPRLPIRFNLLNALESGFHGHSGSGDIALHVSEHIARLVPLNDGEFSRG